MNPVSFLGDQMEPSVTEQPKKTGRPNGGRNKPKRPCVALTNNGRNLAQSLGQCLKCSRGQADQVQARGRPRGRARGRGRGRPRGRGRGRGGGQSEARNSESNPNEIIVLYS